MLRGRAKKSAILGLKKAAALIMRRKAERVELLERHPSGGFWWKCVFKYKDREVRVFWQNYVRRLEVDYVDVEWRGGAKAGCQLTKKELNELINHYA